MSKHLEDYKEILKKYQKLLELWEEIYGTIEPQTANLDSPGSNPLPPPPPPPIKG